MPLIARNCAELHATVLELRAIFRSLHLQGSQLRASKIHLRWKLNRCELLKEVNRTIIPCEIYPELETLKLNYYKRNKIK